MATFTELCADVYTITSRPDLVAETKLAVKAATLKAHQSDYYFKDLYETGIQFSTSDFIQQLDVGTVLPRFRSLKYLRKYDSSGTGAPGKFFNIIPPELIQDAYKVDRTDVAYVAGTTLNIKSATQFQYALLGVYQNPVIDEATYSSWIAAQFPYVIVFESARLLFKQIGYDEQASQFEALVKEQFVELKLNNIEAVGS